MANSPDRWLSTNVAWTAPSNCARDVDTLKNVFRQALADLSDGFCDLGGLDLLSDLRLTVRVHAGDRAEARMNTSVSEGAAVAALELLAPSLQPASARTMVNEPKDHFYVHKTVVHELSMLFLWQATRRKSSGWDFFSGPEWLVDGWEEYLALTRSTEHARTITFPLYRERVRKMWARGIPSTLDRYLDGPIIVESMHLTFGVEQMHALLRANESSFEDALRGVLRVDSQRVLETCRSHLLTHRLG